METLIHGDCIDEMKKIESGSVDLILTDPPYGIKKEKWDEFGGDDFYVEFMGKIFLESERILKDNGQMYFFHNEINKISMLIEWLRKNTNFRLNSFIVCDKGDFRALSWKNPSKDSNLRSWFNTCEYILYYVKGDCLHTEWDKTGWDKVRLDVNNFSNLREYAFNMLQYIGKNVTCKDINKKLGNRKSEHFFYCKKEVVKKIDGKVDHFTRYGSTQWSLPTKETYDELTKAYNLKEWDGFREYEDLRLEYEDLRFTHNLDANHNNVFKMKRDSGENLHSCQKPINILERLIKCSTNIGETVLDCFMGSGSTGIACIKSNRNFIGIERDDKNFKIAKERIENASKFRQMSIDDIINK